MEVNAFVHEAFVKQVQPGMKAEVRIDSFPNLALHGTVQDVAAYYDSTRHWLSGGVKEYSTTVSIDGSTNVAVRSGMTAEVLIQVAELSDSLVVPLSTVIRTRGTALLLRRQRGNGRAHGGQDWCDYRGVRRNRRRVDRSASESRWTLAVASVPTRGRKRREQ